MSTTATRVQEGDRSVAEASHNRKREEVTERKYDFDCGILDCPICMEPFSPPVYQCANGHTTCSACCKKLHRKCLSCTLLTGSIRCIAIEKLVESLSVSCKYIRNGCEVMQTPSDIESHEEYLRKDFLLVPAKDFVEYQSFQVYFKITDLYDDDDDD